MLSTTSTTHPLVFTVIVCMLLIKLFECVCFSRQFADWCTCIVGVRSRCLCVVSFTLVTTLFVVAIVCCMFVLNGGGVSIFIDIFSLCHGLFPATVQSTFGDEVNGSDLFVV